MNTILYVTFFSMIVIFLINLAVLFFYKPSRDFDKAFNKWKISLIILTIVLISYFIFFSAALYTVNASTQTVTFSDGTPPLTVTMPISGEVFGYLNFMNILLVLNVGICIASILMDFQVFGRGRFKKNRA